MVVPDERQSEPEQSRARAIAFAVGRDRTDDLTIFRCCPGSRDVHGGGDSQVGNVQSGRYTGRRVPRRGKAEIGGALALPVAGDEVWPEVVRRRRRVPVALQASADRDEAYVRRRTRVVALDLHEAVDIAEVGLAASSIIDALEIS